MRPRVALPLLLLVALVVGYLVWRHAQPSPTTTSAMAEASVVSSAGDGDSLRLTLRYVARGRTLTTTGTVPAAEFARQGKVVWVCFDPRATDQTRLRLPMDPLCADGG